MGYRMDCTAPPVVNVLSLGLEPLGVIEEYVSLDVSLQLFDVGKFELVLPNAPRARDLLRINRIVDFGHAGQIAGIIEGVAYALTAHGVTMRVYGPMLGGLMRRRIAAPGDDPDKYGWDVASGAAGGIMAHYVMNHCVAPAQPGRAGPLLTVADGAGRIGMETVAKARYQPLNEVLCGVGQFAGVGWRIVISGEAFEFQALPAIDRTSGSDDPLVLSTAFGNIASAEAGSDFTEAANAVYALGEGAYENRLYQVYYPDDQPAEGWERRELAADCGNEPSLARLRELATQRLADCARTDWLTVRLIPDRAEVGLGEIVTVDLPEIGARYDLLVTELRYALRGAQRQVEATLGRPPRTLTGQLRQAQRLRNVT